MSFDDLMVIDEIQRVPELLLAIKVSVDSDQRPGRFLLTGSSRLLGLRDLPDTLPGRMETVELWPFSQGEIDGSPDSFIDSVFRLGPEIRHESDVTRADYADRIVRGGLPEAVARTDPRRRGRFLDGYVQNLVEREVRQLSEIERVTELYALIRLLATRSGLLIAAGNLESELRISRPTIARYLRLLEEVFLVKRIPGWSRNLGSRVTNAAKLVRLGDDFLAGIVLYTGTGTLPFGPKLRAVPVSALWQL